MTLLRSLRNRTVQSLQAVPRRARRRLHGQPVAHEDLSLHSTVGYKILGRLLRPDAPGPWPGVLLCPGTNDGGLVFEGWSQPLNAKELASQGFAVMIFDPAGRGESWGEEDYGGLEHQDNVRVVLKALMAHPAVKAEACLVMSISLGLAMACGALARWPEELPVRALVDWEGPCDREIITAGGKIMAPAMGHSLKDETYWPPREAVRHVGSLRCGYLRVQSERDHAQPEEFRHATRMMEAAAAGSLPWFQLNDHPRGELPSLPQWIPAGRNEANRFLLRRLRELTS